MASVESDIFEIIAEKAAVEREEVVSDAKLEDLEIESLDIVEIVFAIEEKFDVEVKKVATMNRMGKYKNMTVRSGGRTIRTQGSKASWKKAIVTLKEGSSINLLEGDVVE